MSDIERMSDEQLAQALERARQARTQADRDYLAARKRRGRAGERVNALHVEAVRRGIGADTNLTSGDYRRRWFDEVAVEVAMQGRGREVRPSERAEAVRRMIERNASTAGIAETLGISERSVTRIRAWLRAVS